MQIFYELSSINDSFTPELGQHLRHVDANLLRIIVQTGTDEAEAIRCQYPAMQLVGLVLLVLLISYSLFDICFITANSPLSLARICLKFF